MDNIEHRVRAAGRKEKLHDIDPDALFHGGWRYGTDLTVTPRV